MRYLYILFLSFMFFSAKGEGVDLTAFLDTVQLRSYPTPMRFMTRIRVDPSDSIYVERYKETRYFNTDTLFHYLATRGYKAVEDELYYYYYDVLAYMSKEEGKKEVKKLRRIARRYDNAEVTFEAQFLPLFVDLDMEDADKFHAVMDAFHELAKQEASRGNIRNELNVLRFIFNVSYLNGYYARGFRFARITADRLDQLTDKQYADRKATYYMVGKAYHVFRDYDRSIPYFKASVRKDGPLHMADRVNLLAFWNLGDYYASKGDLEQSDFYFFSMWSSPDQVKNRPFYDMVALAGLAQRRQAKRRIIP